MAINLDYNLILSLIVGIFVGAASGYLGSVMVLRRMSLVGDALSHVALPGIGIALTYKINPFLGAFVALALGVIAIWSIQRKTTLPTEAVVGLMFTFSLAIGVLVTPEPELLEALFGDISKVQSVDGIFAVALSAAVLMIMSLIRDKLVLGLISPDLAKSQGVKTDKIDLLFLGLVAIIVALGVKVVGTLLMGSLVIIPAAAAKNIASNLRTYGLLSVLFGILSVLIGVFLSNWLNWPPGPSIVLASSAIFLISLESRIQTRIS
ncbi:MAG: metal ABC transporter permease [Patescibacteria group bacterium]